jgi:Fe2+ or Zn2+ uptake regulation protein
MARTPVISTALLGLMDGRDHHAWTLDDFQAALADRGFVADFSTIFRAAEKLVVDRLIVKVQVDDGRARFELAGDHHDHLHCTRCDELVAVPCVIERDACSALETEIGVAISEHRVILRGLCAKCRAQK